MGRSRSRVLPDRRDAPLCGGHRLPVRTRHLGDAVPGGAPRCATPVRDPGPTGSRARGGAHRDRGEPRRACGGEERVRPDSVVRPRAVRADRRSLRAAGSRHAERDDAGRSARRRVPLGESRNRQGPGHEPAARHGAARRVSDLGRQRTTGLRVVLRPRCALDDAGDDLGRRLHDNADRAGVSAEIPAAGRQDSARDLAVGVAGALVRSVSVRVGERRRDAVVRRRPCGLLARERRSRVHSPGLGFDREGVSLLGGYRQRRQRTDREYERRSRLGRGRCAVSPARGDVSGRVVARGVPWHRGACGPPAGPGAGVRGARRRRADARGGRGDLLDGRSRLLRVCDGAAAHDRARRRARTESRAPAGETRDARPGQADR